MPGRGDAAGVVLPAEPPPPDAPADAGTAAPAAPGVRTVDRSPELPAVGSASASADSELGTGAIRVPIEAPESTSFLAGVAGGARGTGSGVADDLLVPDAVRAAWATVLLDGQQSLDGSIQLDLVSVLGGVAEGSDTSSLQSLVGRVWAVGGRTSDRGRADVEDVVSPHRQDKHPMEQLLIEVTQPAKLTGLSLTAGFVWWLTRGGGMLATVLMSVPAWRHMGASARPWITCSTTPRVQSPRAAGCGCQPNTAPPRSG